MVKYRFMKKVEEAKNIVLANASLLNSVEVSLENATGYVLAEDIFSSIRIPAFPQSSMDGYAIRLKDKDALLPVQDELPAGSSKKITLLDHHAIRVFTGGPVPEGADVVVQKEWVVVAEGGIRINANHPEAGSNIRVPGLEIGVGELAIPAGTLINSFQVAFLASLGIITAEVYRKPVVSLIITGNELVQPGNQLMEGQVYESNSFGLKASLKKAGIDQVKISFAKDNLAETEDKIKTALEESDMVLLTGGVSVGDYDFVTGACLNQGVEPLFHGVKQKPGKPLFFGRKEKKLVFGLPGNPASVLSCYQQYVLPAICKVSGMKEAKQVFAQLSQSYEKKALLTFFLKGYVENGIVSILPAQASFQLSAFAEANCWVELDENISRFEKFQMVRIHLFQ